MFRSNGKAKPCKYFRTVQLLSNHSTSTHENGIFSTSTKTPSSNWFGSIRNFISQKKPESAISIYTRVRGNGGSALDAIPLILKASASLSALAFGKMLHSEILKSGVECDVMVGTSLLDMYGKCQDIASARKVFDEMPEKNVITWNAMIGSYMRNGYTQNAYLLFEDMLEKTSVTWIELIDGYARNRDMVMARQVFEKVPEELKTVVTWTVLVKGYVTNGEMEAAREVFENMKEKNFTTWSVMITAYFKKGDPVKAREIFDRMSVRNLVNWNSLISGYAQNGMPEEAVKCFTTMQEDGFEPDAITFASVLSECAQLGALDLGRKVHGMILEKNVVMSEFVLNGLADMYVKCGDFENARSVFQHMMVRNTTIWNSLINGFAIHGQCREAIELFTLMEKDPLAKPDSITFLSVVSACAHAGFVKEGLEAFSKMGQYGLTANAKHYGCLVDLLGRAGKLQDAYEFVEGMPITPNGTIFGALLGACRMHGDMVMLENVLELVKKVSLDSDCTRKTPGCSVLI